MKETEKKVPVRKQGDWKIVLQERDVKKLFQEESYQQCEISVTGIIKEMRKITQFSKVAVTGDLTIGSSGAIVRTKAWQGWISKRIERK